MFVNTSQNISGNCRRGFQDIVLKSLCTTQVIDCLIVVLTLLGHLVVQRVKQSGGVCREEEVSCLRIQICKRNWPWQKYLHT